MTITQEQFQAFQRHFTITETTLETVKATADIYFESFDKYQDSPDDFFSETDWVQRSAEVISSEGYRIQYILTDNIVKTIDNINDVADFIENDMSAYLAERLAERQQKG